MTVTRSASSFMTQRLTELRNPQGREENWIALGRVGLHSPPAVIENRWTNLAKVTAAEIGFCTLVPLSLVETALYTALKPATLLLYPVTKSPHEFRRKLAESSSFACHRAWNNVFLSPLSQNNLMAHESFVRVANAVHIRKEDIQYVASWVKEKATLQWTERLQSLGAEVLTKIVLFKASARTLEKFTQKDPDIISFMLASCIYEYAFRARSGDSIPHFFKPATQNCIYELREIKLNQGRELLLASMMRNLGQFNTGSLDEQVQEVVALLKVGAEEESQADSLLSSKCLEIAIERVKAAEVEIDLGANFLIKEVLAGATEETLENFKKRNGRTLRFVVTRFIALYAFGSKKTDSLPMFFKETTRDEILQIREAFTLSSQTSNPTERDENESLLMELERLVSSPEQFNVGPLNKIVQAAFHHFLQLANSERENSLLTSRCLPKALDILETFWIGPGAEFLVQEVLAGASQGTLENFKDMDPDIISFVLTKSIYAYAIGSKKEEKVPSFFKAATQKCIESLREDLISLTPSLPLKMAVILELARKNASDELTRLMSSPEQFNIETLNTRAHAIFNRLRAAASEEAQGSSLLTTKCWVKAIEMLNTREDTKP